MFNKAIKQVKNTIDAQTKNLKIFEVFIVIISPITIKATYDKS